MSFFAKPTRSAAIEKRITDTRAHRDKLSADLAKAQDAAKAARGRQRTEIVDADEYESAKRRSLVLRPARPG